ncbi:Eco57I restriction-modification methylase domain-containing protein [Aestuariibaculum lutulentum]|uniref:site-specific DNA-methyltransferase (adenine-specific) n=1 Tax=Aestuariibaculum lutulentum TaxID=2920935 RepID=A0ABS9REI8_9FLAO|nr:Eco57I restriction-modification methylase domain-containing protein [Aestuariibaculum lutulentum]MCH4551368.1 Eco57I restriction-modification methylase domain-containing protein [Aestuariibaculum lutulentum]
MTDTISKPYKVDDLVQSFEEQLELFFSKNFESKSKTPELDENLGQVFTSPVLAKFMISLFKEKIQSNSKILDPCIGPNTFFKLLPIEVSNCFLKGIEIDKSLINDEIEKFYNNSKRTLIKGSFFDLDSKEKFDLIIQNPPYVRQELLANGVNSKSNIKNDLSINYSSIPSQSNLYIYFLLKSILHLNDNGIMVAVIYDSWLYSSFGKFLKNSFLKLGHLESIYHFKKSAFDNADVGATVIKFIKKKNNRKSTSYYSLNDLNDLKTYNGLKDKPLKLDSKEFLAYSFNNTSVINFKSNLFKPLKSIVSKSIQRGTSAIVNNYFIFSEKIYPELKPIVKNISKIKTYKIAEDNSYILALNNSISDKTKQYLNSVKNNILNAPEDKYKAVKQDIAQNKKWYQVKIKSSGNFIFNYYLRNNIDFIYNPNKHLSSDNFYSVNIEQSELAYLAILNSSFTRLNILNNSRSQGNGLRKIQLYEFKEVKVIDIKNISSETIKELEGLGKSLMTSNRYDNQQNEIIKQIDSILLNEYNNYNNSSIGIDELINELKEYIK